MKKNILFHSGNLALVLLLGFLVVKIIFIPSELGSHLTPANVSAENNNNSSSVSLTTTPNPDGQWKNYSEIIQKNLFNAASAKIASPPPQKQSVSPSPQAIISAPKLELIGVTAGDALFARAIIKNLKTQTISRCKIGDSVAKAKVKKILRRSVVLSFEGRQIPLQLNVGKHQSLDPEPIPTPLHNLPKDNTSMKKINHIPAPATSKFDKGIQTLEIIFDAAALEPYKVDGQVGGMRVTEMEAENQNLLEGVKKGDIIRSINGQKLTSQQKSFQIFQKARTQNQLNIEITREGKTQTITLRNPLLKKSY